MPHEGGPVRLQKVRHGVEDPVPALHTPPTQRPEEDPSEGEAVGVVAQPGLGAGSAGCGAESPASEAARQGRPEATDLLEPRNYVRRDVGSQGSVDVHLIDEVLEEEVSAPEVEDHVPELLPLSRVHGSTEQLLRGVRL